MEQRKIRVPAFGVPVRLGEGAGELVNMSISGALMRLDRLLPVGARAPFSMALGPELVAVTARVVRHSALSGAGTPEAMQRWLVGVVFVDVPAPQLAGLRGAIVELHKRAGEPRKAHDPAPVLR